MSKSLPSRPSLEQLRNQAKDLRKQFVAGEAAAVQRVRQFHPDFAGSSPKSNEPLSPSDEREKSFRLHDAQSVIAREYGFANWPRLKEHVESILLETGEPLDLLKQAFHADDAQWLRKLLARYPQFKALINEPIGPFDSPAIINVRSREMLDVLLEAGGDINAKSRWWAGGFGLLHHAEPELAAYALQRGATLDVHAAARLGMLDRLRELVFADPQLVHARGGDGQTPLHFASTVEIAAFLLEQGADIDARDLDHESTPAQWMIKNRREIARFLVQRGCHTDLLMAAALGDMNLVRRHLESDPQSIHLRVTEEFFPKTNPKAGGTIYQWTLGWYVSPHDVARQFGHEDVFGLLMDRSPADVKLIAACWAGDETTVKSLLQEKPGIVAALSDNYKRHTARAARNNNPAAVRLMLAAGLPVDARGQHLATPLHWAAFQGNAGMTREILKYNPPLEVTDADFRSTPLGWALYGSENGWHYDASDYATTVELILNAGAKLPEKLSGTGAVKEVLRRFGG
ncbi:MAG TPA: ankyrin repeat domain-containing protein [Verrucomicrobiae bacterium]|nr:ankyrin repeat domain-containing protein [Verrucomicrobiae bacterium]